MFDDKVYYEWEFYYETGWAKGGTRWGAATHSMADATIEAVSLYRSGLTPFWEDLFLGRLQWLDPIVCAVSCHKVGLGVSPPSDDL